MSATPPRGAVLAVMAGHFVAAFAALGMPPFFALILQQSLHEDAHYLAGWFYVVPTAFAALASPLWGKVADRHGKKRLLIRAQLGLAASFLLAGFASDAWVFFGALALQGLLGGTFAASNAYLATLASGPALVRSLTTMQWSARAALVVAPAAIGLALHASTVPAIQMYRWLALLPLAAAALALWLPNGDMTPRRAARASADLEAEAGPRQVYLLQFGFVFATVATYPYFASLVQQRFVGASTAWSGLLFALPHAVYLAAAHPLTRFMAGRRQRGALALSFAVLAASLAAQALVTSLVALIAWRLAMGAAMTASFVALHGLIAGVVRADNAGRTFGWFESSSKWGGVAAGLCAGLVASGAGVQAPFWLATAVIVVTSFYLQIAARPQLQSRPMNT
jgi:MFS family permease